MRLFQRKSPIATPIDYEQFISKNIAILENDSLRDLLLFPRDDITVEIFDIHHPSCTLQETVTAAATDEQTCMIPSLTQSAEWLLTRDAINLYSSPHHILTFNYSQYAGDFSSRINNEYDNDIVLLSAYSRHDIDLPNLIYESDMAAAEQDKDVRISLIS